MSTVEEILRAYVRKIYVRKSDRGNLWKVARKRRSWTSLNFAFKLNTFYLASILFTRVKFTHVYTHVKITRQWKSIHTCNRLCGTKN